MSHRQTLLSASIGALSLASLLVIFLAVSPRSAGGSIVPSSADEHLGLSTVNPPRVAPTDRDPSVPTASGVRFPSGDAVEPDVATF